MSDDGRARDVEIPPEGSARRREWDRRMADVREMQRVIRRQMLELVHEANAARRPKP